jgi:orotate phosphoribosyltransferase
MLTDIQYQQLWRWGQTYIDTRCIERRDKGNELPGLIEGTKYRWQILPRRGLYDPEFLKVVVAMFEYRISKDIGHTNFQMAGVESAAVPLLIGASLMLGIPSFSVRKERKTYGLLNWIEGTPKPGVQVMLVDDLCNSRRSLRHAYDICLEHGLPIFNYAFVLMNKVNKAIHSEERRRTDMYLPPTINVIYLYDLDDFKLSNPSH